MKVFVAEVAVTVCVFVIAIFYMSTVFAYSVVTGHKLGCFMC